jgi:hypothetical protein
MMNEKTFNALVALLFGKSDVKATVPDLVPV